ncbi:hypothetical protein DW074_02660 [Ruminococcus sp. AF46-10NS]|mgnify:FL=1|jgi:hypothetical protein|nr:hypothetical protein [Ruminococcus sp. AF46-10NS]RHK25695.1 hypothetical protein DW074_02660 [Ruminococcus sp. AF46-10NS]
MFGIIYLILCILTGMEAVGCLFPRRTAENGNRIWVILPTAFGTGVLMLTWAVYIISWMFSVCAGAEHPLFYGNLLVMTLATLVLAVLFKKKKKNIFPVAEGMLTRKWILRKEIILFTVVAVFVTWMMFYVFHIKDGILYSGFSVFGDYAPHTAMMRSFSRGNNFPTQYPHYGGQDVKYHFMFQFLVGNLEYLGLRIDIGYNLVSILSLTGFLMILYAISYRMFHSFCAGASALVFFFFRSGTAFWQYLWEHFRAGDLVETLRANTSFIGYTTNENWGLWNFNVYLNQRHLAFGLLMVSAAVWIFMEWLEAGCSHSENGIVWIGKRIFSKDAWAGRNVKSAVLLGVFLGLTAFWNGAALIGGLLILAGMAVFSDGKLDYAICAALAVFFSELQSKLFVSGSVMSPSFYWGFLAENKSLVGVIGYLAEISGFFFVGLVVTVVFLKRKERAVLFGFLLPLVFAFLVSLTPDINVNHKYVMISYAFTAVFWGWTVRRIFLAGKTGWKKWLGRVVCGILCICLTLTGIYDYVIILRDNDSGHRVTVNMNSDLTDWLSENLHKEDLLLTPEYTMNEVTMAGVMLYCGWPYYAWSAGYDTYYRAEQAVTIYTTDDQNVLKETVKQEKITYILFEDGMSFESQECREDIIRETYPLVYTSEDGRIRIYETR